MPHCATAAFDLGILTDVSPAGGKDLRWPETAYSHLCRDRSFDDPTVCIFQANSVNFRNSTAKVWWYDNRERRWHSATSALPRVVYNRISRRQTEQSPAGKRLVRGIIRRRPFFNPWFFDKLNVYDLLRTCDSQSALLDYTALRDSHGALDFYRRHEDIYLKPSAGSLGNGIGRLRRIGRNRHELRWNQPAARSVLRQTLSDEQLAHLFRRLPTSGRYLLQATALLIRWRQSPVDLRALVQKDTHGRWSLTGMAGRVGASGAITTHTVHGGSSVSFCRLKREASGPLPPEEAIAHVCCQTARLLDKNIGGLFELSFDLALKSTAHPSPVILEVNAKPFPFDENDIRHKARRKILAFTRAVVERPALLTPIRGSRKGGE